MPKYAPKAFEMEKVCQTNDGERQMKAVEYMPSDYTWVISKDTEANPNTAKFDVILKVVEFDVEYDFETAKEAESSVEEIIQSLIETRVKKQKLELPIPFFASHSAKV